jgi:hypothetical protein
MSSHLFSLHPSIWEIVENGMHFDSTNNPVLINEQIHKNAQATTVLLASLCRDEYNKVSGLDNAKQIWDTLKISHEGNDTTMITKMELVEGELGRFTMKRGEEPTKTYNRLKTLVNKIRSYGSTRWTYHDVVRLMLRSFTVIDPHLVNLIRENPEYTKMTPEEILGKFISGRMMVKEARYVDDIANGPLPLYELQLIALKATSSKVVWGTDIPQVHSGVKTLLEATCQSTHYDASSWARQREWQKWADPGIRWAHTRITRGLGMIRLKLFAFPAPDILKRRR